MNSICETCLIRDGCKFADSGLLMEHCKMFVGMPKMTNFERFTASPYALARFVNEVIRVAPSEELYPKSFWEYTQLHGASVGTIIEWLEQESE